MLTELQVQIRLIKWAKETYPLYCIDMYHVPNSTFKNRIQQGLHKMGGLTKGVSDVVLPRANEQFHQMFIELKRDKGGKLSDEQRNFLIRQNSNGNCGVVARGLCEARQIVEYYVSNHPGIEKFRVHD